MINEQSSFLHKLSSLQWLLVFAFFLLIVKLVLLPFAHAVDADGITRVLMSRQWAADPGLIKEGSWPPFYFYVMGAALHLCDNQYYTPLVVNVLLSVLSLFPLYFLMKRLFNAQTGLCMCLVFALSPIVFRVSLLQLSETLSIFFMLLTANVLVKGLQENNNKLLLLAGLCASIAGGFRYESWIISPLVAAIVAWRYSFRQSLFFLFTASLFPLYWLASNYIYRDNMFGSFTWATAAIISNKINSGEDLLRRIWWYPLSLFFVFGPVGFYFFVREIVYVCRNRKIQRTAFLFFFLFVIVFLFFLINCLGGSLLMQHRFTLTLFLLSFPFLGFYFKDHAKHKIKMALLIALSAFGFSFIYNSRGIRPVPRLEDKAAEKVAQVIQTNLTADPGLIVDSWNFESTYYVAFMSGLPQSSIAVFDQNPQSVALELGHAITILDLHPTGFIVFHKNGKLQGEMTIEGNELTVKSSGQHLKLEPVYTSGEIVLYKYQKE
jgi:4-amino-4-deoxy-L-arabinose transferase-like glycosyltransferase